MNGQHSRKSAEIGYKILFVGNSLTLANDLPNLVVKEANRRGLDVETDIIAKPNYCIVDHWEEGDMQKAIASGAYDYVVTQQGPSSQALGYQMLVHDMKPIAQLCADNDVQLAYLMVWPSKYDFKNFDDVIANYSAGAEANNAILCPVGEVWKEHFMRTQDYSYYGPDKFHPSPKGSQVAAEVVVSHLFEQDNLPSKDGLDKMRNYDIQLLDNGLILMPFTLYGKNAATGLFVFDTGAGVHAISPSFYQKLYPEDSLTENLPVYTGFRHDGERLDLDYKVIDSLTFHGIKQTSPTVAIYEKLQGSGVDGIIGLKFIEDRAMTIDYKNGTVLFPTDEELADISAVGEEVSFAVKSDKDIALSMFLNLYLDKGPTATVEFDTGTPYDNWLLHPRYATQLTDVAVDRAIATANEVVINEIALEGYSSVRRNVSVIFKEMIYDGLIGAGFFINKTVTIDVPNKRLIVCDAE